SLVVQIDVAQAGDDHDLSVEDNLSDFRNAVVCVEICDAAAQSRLLLVLLQQEPQATRHIDSGELGEGLLDLSVRNHDRERPVRGGGKGMHRIAMAMHLQSPDESTFERRFSGSLRMKLRKLHVGEAHIQLLGRYM